MTRETVMHCDFCHAYGWVYQEENGDLTTIVEPRRHDDFNHWRRKDCDDCQRVARGEAPTDLGELRDGMVAIVEWSRSSARRKVDS